MPFQQPVIWSRPSSSEKRNTWLCRMQWTALAQVQTDWNTAMLMMFKFHPPPFFPHWLCEHEKDQIKQKNVDRNKKKMFMAREKQDIQRKCSKEWQQTNLFIVSESKVVQPSSRKQADQKKIHKEQKLFWVDTQKLFWHENYEHR